jgi:hypothetical protein
MAVKTLGTGGSTGILYLDRRDFYIDPQVVKELWTDVAPFTTVLSNRETRSLKDPIFKMFEHRNPWIVQKIQIDEAVTVPNSDVGVDLPDVIATVGLEGGDGLNDTEYSSWAGLICEVWAADAVWDGAGGGDISGTASKGTVLIRENASGDFELLSLSDAEIVTAQFDWLVVIGNAHGEGTVAPEAWADELQVVYNSTQIFKTPLEITGTLLQASLRGESSELARLRSQKSMEHKMQKERAFLFGQRRGGTNLDQSGETFGDDGSTDGGGKKVRTTYGMVSALNKYGASSGDNQSVFTISEAAYTYGDFVDDMEKVFQYVPDSGVKRAFCGSGALSYWSKMAGSTGIAGKSGWTVNLGDMKRDSLGFNYKVLETPHGVLQLIPTPALRGPYNGYMLVIEDGNMFHAQYRSPMFQANVKSDNAYDGVKDQYFSDEGIGISLIESHNLMKVTT